MPRAENTRQKIVDQAAVLMMQRGLNGFSYKDISTPLGVKNAAIHYHFPTKVDLVMALIEEQQDTLRKQTTDFMTNGGQASKQVEGLFFYARQKCVCGQPVCIPGSLMVDYNDMPEHVLSALQKLMKDTGRWFTHVLEVGREQGEFEFNGEAKSKAAGILAMMQGARQLTRVHGDQFLETIFEQIRQDLGMKA